MNALVDIALIDLDRGSAWQFDLRASQAIENSRLPADLQKFADSVRLDLVQARKGHCDKPFVKFMAYAPLKSIQQRISYRYGLLSSDYTVELTHFQDRSFRRLPSGLVTSIVFEARWSLEVHHNLWDTMFEENAHLPVGARAHWSDDAWFPVDEVYNSTRKVNDGFAKLMGRLNDLKDVVWPSE